MTRGRLDHVLVARGLVPSRSQAQQLIRAGLVEVDGQVATKASMAVGPDSQVLTRQVDDTASTQELGRGGWIARGWVGRGALKLDHALRAWEPAGLEPAGRRCLDVGASTGGFTQVLLEHGAAHVVALDVGRDQLDPRLRADPRVTELSGTSVRDVEVEGLGGPFGVVVADLSFISLSLVLPVLSRLAEEGAHLVLLVKPQFEVGREALAGDGVVRSADARARVLARLDQEARGAGLGPVDLLRSPVTGTTGNIEYLWWLRRCRTGMMDCGRAPEQLAARRRELRGQEEP